MNYSKLTKHQTQTKKRMLNKGRIEVQIRYDDECNNGHNTFAITGTLYKTQTGTSDKLIDVCGCIHDEIIKYFPELAKYIKWHLTSADGPMHYIENTMYHLKQGNLEVAQSCAVWPEATPEEFTEANLKTRLPALMVEFRQDIEELGFIF